MRPALFVQVFCSQHSGRLSFALVGTSGRLYGREREHGLWQRHLFGQPEQQAGRDSQPLDDERSCMAASHPPIPFDQPCLVGRCSVIPEGRGGLAGDDETRPLAHPEKDHGRKPGSGAGSGKKLSNARSSQSRHLRVHSSSQSPHTNVSKSP